MVEIKNLTKVYKLTKKQMAEQKTKKNMKKAASEITLTANTNPTNLVHSDQSLLQHLLFWGS